MVQVPEKKVRFGLAPRVLLIVAVMLAGIAAILVLLSLRQQQELILEYSMKAIEGRLEPVETKTEEIRFYANQIQKLQKASQYYRTNIDGDLYFSKERYDSLQDSLRSSLSASGQSNVSEYTWNQILYLSRRLNETDRAIAASDDSEKIKQILRNYTYIGRSLDSLILNQTGYQSVLRSQFQGLDSGFRIQTVGLFFHAYFDTTLLEPGRDLDYEITKILQELGKADLDSERRSALLISLQQLRQKRSKYYSIGSRQVNLLRVGTDPEIIATLDSIREQYYQKNPATKTHHHEFSSDSSKYLISVRTLFMNPSISQRAIEIQNALNEADNRQIWLKLLALDRKLSLELQQIGRKLLNHRESHKTLADFRKDPVTKDLIQQYEQCIEQRNSAIEQARKSASKSDQTTAESIDKEIQRLISQQSETEKRVESLEIKLADYDQKIQSEKNKEDLENLQLEQQNLKYELEEEKTRLKELTAQLPQLENRKEQLFSKSDRVADAFLHLRSAMLHHDSFLEIDYDDRSYYTYTTSKNLRELQRKRWDGLKKWILSACSETLSCGGVYLPSLSRGSLILPARAIIDRMIQYDSMQIDQLARLALFQNTAAYTRVFMDRSKVDRELNSEKDQLLDMALSIGIRMLLIALLVAMFFVRRIKQITDSARQVGEGNFNTQFSYSGNDELGELSRTLNRMTADLKHRESMLGELTAASQIQSQLLPEAIPENFTDTLSFGTLYRASSGVGGDYFDFMPIDDNRLLFCIADVTGHGPGPAMIMAMMRSHLHSLVQSGHSSINHILVLLNERLYSETPSNVFITMFLGIYNKQSHRIDYCSAGHNKSILYRYESESIEELKAGGLPLGLEEKEIFEPILEPASIQLAKGDLFFQYTDGINEATDADLNQYSTDRLKKLVQILGKKKPSVILKNLTGQLEQFTGKKIDVDGPTELADDIAVILFRRIK